VAETGPLAPTFLSFDEVLALHADQVRRYGGDAGLRDAGLLSSALAVPRATFDGAFLHGTLFEMAAAYLFHLCQDHPFLDGNKRTALAAALAFLWLNDHEIEADPHALTELVLDVARGEATKSEVAVFLRRSACPVSDLS
jgi:death-on-curing protein